VAASSFIIPINEGQFTIVAPSTLAVDNPVNITNQTTPGEIPTTKGLDGRTLEQIERINEQQLGDGVLERGLVTIQLRGNVR
jgi:hypothetical protein